MSKLLKIAILLLMVMVIGCKSKKAIITSAGTVNNKLSSKQVIKAHQSKGADFKTLQSRVKIDYNDGEKSQGFAVKLRVEKDKKIWISEAILGSVRALVTPEKVQFYNRWSNEYFDGDYKLISNLLGTELDFEKLQSLLLGEAIYDLENDRYSLSTNEEAYILEPRKQRELFELFLLFDPENFKMKSLQITQSQEQRFLEVDYKTYQKIEKQTLPENIRILAAENTDEVIIQMELKSIILNQELRFPFRIPSGFDEIIIE